MHTGHDRFALNNIFDQTCETVSTKLTAVSDSITYLGVSAEIVVTSASPNASPKHGPTSPVMDQWISAEYVRAQSHDPMPIAVVAHRDVERATSTVIAMSKIPRPVPTQRRLVGGGSCTSS